jgi:hypothetical protein
MPSPPIIARPAEHRDSRRRATARKGEPHRRRRHGRAGAFHQRAAGRARRNRRCIGHRHVLRREQVTHVPPVGPFSHGLIVCRRPATRKGTQDIALSCQIVQLPGLLTGYLNLESGHRTVSSTMSRFGIPI